MSILGFHLLFLIIGRRRNRLLKRGTAFVHMEAVTIVYVLEEEA